jgi:uncharacterized protein YecE (DUF72 family)
MRSCCAVRHPSPKKSIEFRMAIVASLPFSETAVSFTLPFLIDTLREGFFGKVVWEPRHHSWFAPEVEALWDEYRISRVAADPACVPVAAQPSGCDSLFYFRLHGSPRRYYSSYSEDFLDSLASELARFAMIGNAWCIFDNTASGFAIPNGLALQGRLNARNAISE